MIQVKLIDKMVMKKGSIAGQIMATFRLSEEEKDMQFEQLKEKYLDKEIQDENTVYKVLGVSNVHFFLPGQPPSFGVLLKEMFKLIGEYDTEVK